MVGLLTWRVVGVKCSTSFSLNLGFLLLFVVPRNHQVLPAVDERTRRDGLSAFLELRLSLEDIAPTCSMNRTAFGFLSPGDRLDCALDKALVDSLS